MPKYHSLSLLSYLLSSTQRCLHHVFSIFFIFFQASIGIPSTSKDECYPLTYYKKSTLGESELISFLCSFKWRLMVVMTLLSTTQSLVFLYYKINLHILHIHTYIHKQASARTRTHTHTHTHIHTHTHTHINKHLLLNLSTTNKHVRLQSRRATFSLSLSLSLSLALNTRPWNTSFMQIV